MAAPHVRAYFNDGNAMLLTAAGVLFSGYQLWHAMNPKSRKVTVDETDITKAQQKSTASTFAFGDGKFEITSPIVGILILLISLVALYFFLTFVYSIEVMPLNGL